MTDTIRTLLYVGVAAVALLIAALVRPAAFDRATVDDSGQRFFAEIDPLEARSLEIITLDPDSSSRNAFKVAQVNGLWSIPSHENYPADAQDHLAQAASSVMDLTRGPSVSDSPADHEIYGVVDPSEAAAGAGAGTRVTLRDAADKTLIDFIIGKAVKDAPQLRYVRVPGRDRVYTAQVVTDQLSTRFEDWIERDLLKIDPAHIRQIAINDYSIDELNQRLNRGDSMTMRNDVATATWTLDGLAAGETLQTQKLDAMRGALDDLRIVDVHRKPAGLSQQLQAAGQMQLNSEAVNSLMSRGYYIVNGQLLSNEGELLVKTDEGVAYTLRFGEVTNFSAGASNAGVSDSESGPGEPSTQSGRYVFVTAEFDPSLIEQPQYEAVPAPPATAPATAPASVPDTQSAGPPAPQPAVDQAIEQARQAVIERNDRKKAEHDQKVTAGQDKVKDLNRRFSDWYYVVSDGEYQKLRLRRSDLVTPAAATQPAATQPVAPAVAPIGVRPPGNS